MGGTEGVSGDKGVQKWQQSIQRASNIVAKKSLKGRALSLLRKFPPLEAKVTKYVQKQMNNLMYNLQVLGERSAVHSPSRDLLDASDFKANLDTLSTALKPALAAISSWKGVEVNMSRPGLAVASETGALKELERLEETATELAETVQERTDNAAIRQLTQLTGRVGFPKLQISHQLAKLSPDGLKRFADQEGGDALKKIVHKLSEGKIPEEDVNPESFKGMSGEQLTTQTKILVMQAKVDGFLTNNPLPKNLATLQGEARTQAILQYAAVLKENPEVAGDLVQVLMEAGTKEQKAFVIEVAEHALTSLGKKVGTGIAPSPLLRHIMLANGEDGQLRSNAKELCQSCIRMQIGQENNRDSVFRGDHAASSTLGMVLLHSNNGELPRMIKSVPSAKNLQKLWRAASKKNYTRMSQLMDDPKLAGQVKEVARAVGTEVAQILEDRLAEGPPSFPQDILDCMRTLDEAVAKQFPGKAEIPLNALFLRGIAPVISNWGKEDNIVPAPSVAVGQVLQKAILPEDSKKGSWDPESQGRLAQLNESVSTVRSSLQEFSAKFEAKMLGSITVQENSMMSELKLKQPFLEAFDQFAAPPLPKNAMDLFRQHPTVFAALKEYNKPFHQDFLFIEKAVPLLAATDASAVKKGLQELLKKHISPDGEQAINLAQQQARAGELSALLDEESLSLEKMQDFLKICLGNEGVWNNGNFVAEKFTPFIEKVNAKRASIE